VLELLAQDAFDPLLKTHKLRGQLEGLWSCWVEYDCRIVFTFEPDPESAEDMIGVCFISVGVVVVGHCQRIQGAD